MSTIGRHHRKPGTGTAICDTCGVRYYRSQLRNGPDGLLRCVGAGTNNDGKGRTAKELGELESAAANSMWRRGPPDDGAVESDDYTQQVDP